MTLAKSDFTLIKWGVIAFLLAMAAGGSALVYSSIYSSRAKQALSSAQHQMNDARRLLGDARSRLFSTQEDQKKMAAYAQEYDDLVKRSIIGSEPRLDWIEGMDKIRKQHYVLDFKYAIAPQQPYTPPLPVDSGGYDLKLSTMTLHFDLLHEEQLMHFFDALQSSMKGRFILDRCALERTGASPENGTVPQLKAECSGGWLTLQKRGAK